LKYFKAGVQDNGIIPLKSNIFPHSRLLGNCHS